MPEDDDWLFGIVETHEALKAELVAAKPRKQIDIRKERIAMLEQSVVERSLRVAAAVSKFGEVDIEDEEACELMKLDWQAEYGKEEGGAMFRLARAAWMDSKSAPIGLKLNMDLASSVIRARAKGAPEAKPLNIMVQINGGSVVLEEMEVE